MTRGSDVLVVGGGPAGTTTAFHLARAGFSVNLIDRARFPREKVCGESLSPGAVERLKFAGLWPMAESPEAVASAEIRGMRIHVPSGRTFTGRYRERQHGAGVRRTLLDAHLLEMARRAGVNISEQTLAFDAQVSTAGGQVDTRDASGARLRFEARRVVIADGRSSFLARQLGFIAPSRGPSRFAVRAHFEGVIGLDGMAEMHVARGGYCGIAPIASDRANVCYVVFGRTLSVQPSAMADHFLRHLDRFPAARERIGSAVLAGPVRAIGPLRLRASRMTLGPFIACGDTTGFLDPFTGEGMGHAIASGIAAAATIADSIRGDSRAFDRYPEVIRALRGTKAIIARSLYSVIPHPRLANATASAVARLPGFSDRLVRAFGDQL